MIKNAQQAIYWIYNEPKKISFFKKNTLERINRLLDDLGRPQKKLPPIIHVTGTNGKGSTSRFSQAILTESGFKTGLFISPYIVSFNERIQIDGKNISDEDLVKYTEIVSKHYSGQSSFEIITAIAILYFADAGLDALVMEVGIGGKWDSTNVINATVAVITSIGLDHMEMLGDTIEKISAQKAGIIKDSTKAVVYGRLPSAAKKVIENQASIKKVPFGEITGKIKVSRGYYQQYNAALAWAAVKVFCHETLDNAEFLSLIDSWKEDRLIKFLNSIYWPGRMEIFSKKPFIVLDGAHNKQGVKTLADSLLKQYGDKEQLILFGHLKSKHISTEDFSVLPLAKFFPVNWKFEKETSFSNDYPDWKDQLNSLIKKIDNERQMIVVTGSLYFVSLVRNYLEKQLASIK
ncbi:bifunctional folylpolyglutamate synthase/dihydrofolate synthase [Oenococcus alcoholitolerans]|uniref:bifunctional folylpolyglutamate synthase/dihydrofolate synthase n=1 Tax=Oenococcus alcoholitolerans TaxID=931074 RepID=UPI003F70F153